MSGAGRGGGSKSSVSYLVGRRDLLRGVAVLALPAGLVLPACSKEEEPPKRFQHGIASGDPLTDAVMIWTRVTGDGGPVDVAWEVAEDPEMTKKVASGDVRTDADRDFTVKVDVRGLAAGRTYYYRFKALGDSSRVGRTRTAPTGAVSRLRLAVVSCASYAHGYFHGYRALSQQPDLDAVVHLGDYIYEYGDGDYGDVRQYEPHTECLTLADYRTRHSYYKRDASLQEVHRQHPFITVWDDHETANDAYKDGAENHNPSSEGSYAERKAAAIRAYFEWMPIREQPNNRIYRKLAYGDLVDLVMLDTRLYARTKQASGIVGPSPAPDPTRTLLGDEQTAWLEDQLRTSTARWKLLGQQVMVGNIILKVGGDLANLDQWHGYPESRARLLTFLRDSGVKNTVILTGDIHSSWANEIVGDPNNPAEYDPATGRGSLAVEFVAPGITSPGIPPIFLGIVESARPSNPHVRYIEPSHRGFMILDVTHERVQSAWHHFADVTIPEPQTPYFAAAWSVRAGETRLNQDQGAAPAATDRPALVP